MSISGINQYFKGCRRQTNGSLNLLLRITVKPIHVLCIWKDKTASLSVTIFQPNKYMAFIIALLKIYKAFMWLFILFKKNKYNSKHMHFNILPSCANTKKLLCRLKFYFFPVLCFLPSVKAYVYFVHLM